MAILGQKLDIFLIESSSLRWTSEWDGIRNAPSEPSRGFTVVNNQKKIIARAIQDAFTLQCCSERSDSSLWSLVGSVESCYLTKGTSAATWMLCKQLQWLCYTTRQPDTGIYMEKKSWFICQLLLCFSMKQQKSSNSSSVSCIPDYNCTSKLPLTAGLLCSAQLLICLCW